MNIQNKITNKEYCIPLDLGMLMYDNGFRNCKLYFSEGIFSDGKNWYIQYEQVQDSPSIKFDKYKYKINEEFYKINLK